MGVRWCVVSWAGVIPLGLGRGEGVRMEISRSIRVTCVEK